MMRRYPTGCGSIDDMLNGGIESGIVTQIYGESASGKTNLCLQFARTTLESDPSGRVVYVDCEGLSGDRLGSIMEHREDLESRLMIFPCLSLEEQVRTVEDLKKLVEKVNILAIIVDSITVFYRKDVNTDCDGMARKMLNSMLVNLLALARRRDIPVLITNQIYTEPETGSNLPLGGNVIAHNTKAVIELSRKAHAYRTARLAHHRSIRENTEARFIITDRGLSPA